MKNIEPEGKGRTFHIEPLIAALVLAAAGQHYLYNAKAALPGMILFALAAGLFIFADMRAQKAGITGAPGVPLKAEIVIFAGIMLAAVFFRFYMLDTLPAGAHRDEAKAALDALYLAAGRQPLDSGSKFPVYIGGITDNPAFYNYVMGVFYGFIDHGIMPARAASAFLGVLAVAAVYFLARASFGVNAAVAAGFMTAVSRWHFTFTRHVLHAGLLVFILALALYFCVKARRQGRTALFLLAGACCGMVFYTFQASRAFAVVMLVCAALLFIVDRAFLRENRDRVAAGSTVFLIVIIPLAVYAVFNGQVFMKRANELFLFSQARLAAMQGGAPELLQVYLASLKKSLLMFNVTGSANLVYNYNYRPMFDMVTGAFFMMGLFYSVYRASLGSRLHICLIVLFLAGIHGTALFIEAPYATRGILALLPALLMAACAAERLFSLAYRAATGMAKPAAVAGAAALAFAAASLNYTGYFVDFKRDSLAWDAFSADSRLAGAYFRKMMPGWNAILDPRYTQPYENYSFVLECGCLEKGQQCLSPRPAVFRYSLVPGGRVSGRHTGRSV
jgi:4-amino-4-deoxy-L-arabinose transferase-like glycosyltransferase